MDYIILAIHHWIMRDEGLRAQDLLRATLRKDSLYTFNQQMLEAWLGITPDYLDRGFPRIHLVIRPEFLLEAAFMFTGDCSTAELSRNIIIPISISPLTLG